MPFQDPIRSGPPLTGVCDAPLVVLVCGSRDWNDEDTIAECIRGLAWERHCRILHGAARGADRIASAAAEFYGCEVQAFPADWDRYGKRAGILRNLQMFDERPDLVIAFQRNASRGTQHTISEAKKRGIPVEVHVA